MKQEGTNHTQKSYPLNPQTRPYCHDDDENEVRDADSIEGSGHRNSIRDWQNPSRFRHHSAR